MKTIKKIGKISNGNVIEFEGKKVTVSGVWNNTKVSLRDEEGNQIYGYYLVGKGGAFNGTLYNAVIAKDTKHPIFQA